MNPVRNRKRFVSLWGWPMALGLLTSIGLVSALFSEGGWGDLLSGVCLGLVTLVGLWHSFVRST